MIYFLEAENHVKIGSTRNHATLAERVATLQTGHHAKLKILGTCEGTRDDELEIQRLLQPDRTQGEWFRYTAHVRETIEDLLRAKVAHSYTTPPVVARELGVCVDKVLGWIRDGKLRALNLGDGRKLPRYRVDRIDLQAFLERRVVQPPVKPARRPRRQPAGVTTYF